MNDNDDKVVSIWIVALMLVVSGIVIALSTTGYIRPTMRSIRNPGVPTLDGEYGKAGILAVDHTAGSAAPVRD